MDAELQGRIDAYALGGLDERERRELEDHMATRATPAERAAFKRAVETASLLAQSLPASPPAAEIWTRIASTIRTSRPPAAGAARARSSRLAWAVAAAALLVLVLVLADRSRHMRAEEAQQRRLDATQAQLDEAQQALADARREAAALEACRRELAALGGAQQFAGQAVALLELPGTQLIPLERAPRAANDLAANAIYHRGVKQAYVVIAGLPHAPGTLAIEVWVLRDGRRELAGQAVPDASGRALLTVPRPALDPGVPAGFEVTDSGGNVLLSSRVPI